MRCCAAVACTNNSRHLEKWKETQCDIHLSLHEQCECKPPFRSFYFPADIGKRQEWVKKVNREEKNAQLWQPKTVFCALGIL